MSDNIPKVEPIKLKEYETEQSKYDINHLIAAAYNWLRHPTVQSCKCLYVSLLTPSNATSR